MGRSDYIMEDTSPPTKPPPKSEDSGRSATPDYSYTELWRRVDNHIDSLLEFGKSLNTIRAQVRELSGFLNRALDVMENIAKAADAQELRIQALEAEAEARMRRE